MSNAVNEKFMRRGTLVSKGRAVIGWMDESGVERSLN